MDSYARSEIAEPFGRGEVEVTTDIKQDECMQLRK